MKSLLIQDEFKYTFFSLKSNKSSGFDDISVNVLRQVFGMIKNSLIYFFNFSLNKGVFPDKLILAGVFLSFKNGEKCKLTNYKPVSVLAFISPILERIMYNRFYHCFDENSLLFKKQSFTNGIIIIWY